MGRVLYFHHYFPALIFNSMLTGNINLILIDTTTTITKKYHVFITMLLFYSDFISIFLMGSVACRTITPYIFSCYIFYVYVQMCVKTSHSTKSDTYAQEKRYQSIANVENSHDFPSPSTSKKQQQQNCRCYLCVLI